MCYLVIMVLQHFLPKAQKFFRAADDGMEELDSKETGSRVTLKEAGYGLLGPHSIWMEVDFDELFSSQGATLSKFMAHSCDTIDSQ